MIPGTLMVFNKIREISVGVWITHIVTRRRTAHRISASMPEAATRDRKTDGDGIRCRDSLWVTMWVIHTVGADLSRTSPIYRPSVDF